MWYPRSLRCTQSRTQYAVRTLKSDKDRYRLYFHHNVTKKKTVFAIYQKYSKQADLEQLKKRLFGTTFPSVWTVYSSPLTDISYERIFTNNLFSRKYVMLYPNIWSGL